MISFSCARTESTLYALLRTNFSFRWSYIDFACALPVKEGPRRPFLDIKISDIILHYIQDLDIIGMKGIIGVVNLFMNTVLIPNS